MQSKPDIQDPKDYSINGRFFKRLIMLSRPYWTRKGAWTSWLIFMAFILFSIIETSLGAKLSFLTKQMSDALVNKQEVSYWHVFMLVTFIGFVINGGIANQFFDFIYSRLSLHWRSWMTRDLMKRYLSMRTYYRIEQDSDIDNVDQRIQQETGPFCDMVGLLPRVLLSSISNMSVQGLILYSILPVLFYGVIIYGLITAVITWWLYKPYIKLSFDSTVAEADMRYGILHIRNNAETIALYRGERAEALSVESRLIRVIKIALATLRYQLVLSATQSGLGVIWTLLPVVTLVPLYFSDTITFGVITQGTASAAILLQGIQRFTDFFPVFASAAPHVVRLAQIVEKAVSVDSDSKNKSFSISFNRGTSIKFDGLTLQTPGGERTLLRELSMKIEFGEHLLITGQTGVGKSSLLRAMAGVWTSGKGTITMPNQDSVLFLPQRPYMLLGSLREQILYPSSRISLSDMELQELLKIVDLSDLAMLHGGFDSVIDWSRVLSLGEQQRIGIARALAASAKYVILDESTSAVDHHTEQRLYCALITNGATLVSVGHRMSLLKYHVNVLEIKDQGKYLIKKSDSSVAEQNDALDELSNESI